MDVVDGGEGGGRVPLKREGPRTSETYESAKEKQSTGCARLEEE
jgi:hypothetical protein